jgi:hypothetical protein
MSVIDYTANRGCAGTCTNTAGQSQDCVGNSFSCGCPGGNFILNNCYVIPDTDPCDNVVCSPGFECNNGNCVPSLSGCLDTGITSETSLNPFGICDNVESGSDSYCACNSSASYSTDCSGNYPNILCSTITDCENIGIDYPACSANGMCIDVSCCTYPTIDGPTNITLIDAAALPDLYLNYQCTLNEFNTYCVYGEGNCFGVCNNDSLYDDDCGVECGTCWEVNGCECECPEGYGCDGICGSGAEYDDCDVCDPCGNGTVKYNCPDWNSSCTGCTDHNALNYNAENTISCTDVCGDGIPANQPQCHQLFPDECAENGVTGPNCCCSYSDGFILYTCTDIDAMNYNILCNDTIIVTTPNYFDLDVCNETCGTIYLDCLFDEAETPHADCMNARDVCLDACEASAAPTEITEEIISPYICYDDNSCIYPINLPDFKYVILENEPSTRDFGQYFYTTGQEWTSITGLDSIESTDDLSTNLTPPINFDGVAEITTGGGGIGNQLQSVGVIPNDPVYGWFLPKIYFNSCEFFGAIQLLELHQKGMYQKGLTLNQNKPLNADGSNYLVDNYPSFFDDDECSDSGNPSIVDVPPFGYFREYVTYDDDFDYPEDFYTGLPNGEDCSDPNNCGAYKSLGVEFYAISEEKYTQAMQEAQDGGFAYDRTPKPVYEFRMGTSYGQAGKFQTLFVISLDGAVPGLCEPNQNTIGCIPNYDAGNGGQHYPQEENYESLGIAFYAFSEPDNYSELVPIVECHNSEFNIIGTTTIGYSVQGNCSLGGQNGKNVYREMHESSWNAIYSWGNNLLTAQGIGADWNSNFETQLENNAYNDAEGNIVFYAYPNATVQGGRVRPITHAYIGSTADNIKFLNRYYDVNDLDYIYTSAPNIVKISMDVTDKYMETLITKDDIILPGNYPEDLQYVFMIASWDGEIKTNEEIDNEYTQLIDNDNIEVVESTNKLYTYQTLRNEYNNINYFEHQYLTSGVKIVKAIFSEMSISTGNFYKEKIVTIKLNLNTDQIYIEDFQDIGGPDFVYLPWPHPGRTPIINGFTPDSKYIKSVKSVLQSANFDETEVVEQALAQKSLNNTELGKFINKIDIEQVRVFNTGRYDIGALLQIETYYDNILDPSKEKWYEFYPHTAIGMFEFWDGIFNKFPEESSVDSIFINDMIDENIKSDCILELNCGEFDARTIRDSSGSGNKGIVVGDFHVEKVVKGQPATRRGPMDVPKKDKKSRAL